MGQPAPPSAIYHTTWPPTLTYSSDSKDEIDAYLPNKVKEGEEILGLCQKAGGKQDRVEEMLALRFPLLWTLVCGGEASQGCWGGG